MPICELVWLMKHQTQSLDRPRAKTSSLDVCNASKTDDLEYSWRAIDLGSLARLAIVEKG